jgi:quercetin dioxygenase-like cupin family protein
MKFNYPHTIDNGSGEELTFVRLIEDADGGMLEVENRVRPGAGPPMHVHFLQEESLTVVQGKMAAQILGQPPVFCGTGETLTFKRGEVHRFWNSGEEDLICRGWIKPAHNIEYFLTEIFRSIKVNGGKSPSKFDGAYLLSKYKTEFDLADVPTFVKKVIFPVTLFIGRVLGKYHKYEGGPDPVKGHI